MYSCWCTQCTQCTHKKIVQCTQRTQQCTQSVHTCQMFTTSGRVQLYTVRQYRMSVRCMAASDIRISTSSREFSTRIFLPTQIYRILENFFDFSKVPDRFSTSWNSELHSRRWSYAIMATWPSISMSLRLVLRPDSWSSRPDESWSTICSIRISKCSSLEYY